VVAATLAAAMVAGSCADELDPLPESSPIGLALASIRAHEDELRRGTDFTAVVGRHRALGPDPYRVALAPSGEHVVGLLRGEDAVVLLDRDLAEIARAPAPRLASALAVDGDVAWAAGEGSRTVSRLAIGEGSLEPLGTVDLGDGASVRDLAVDRGIVFAVDAVHDVLVAFDASGERARIATAEGPIRVVATPRWIVVASLVGHRIEVFARDAAGLPTAERRGVYARRGPVWAIDAREDESGGLWVAASGVEDEELDRTIGAFGYVDSVVEIFRHGASGLARRATVNVAAHGVVVPKAIALELADGEIRVRAVGAGSARGIDLVWSRSGSRLDDGAPIATTWPALPGTTSFVGGPGAPLVAASPLFDGFWVSAPDRAPPIVLARTTPSASRTSTASERLGEALLTTTLLAPGQSSDGAFSRFTCETCHFELGIDGRTHLTGRDDDTSATTKPLYGLLENGPHFTRALDRDLTEVAHNEVRVANLHVPVNPWLAIDRGSAPWLDALIDEPEPGLYGPAGVRRAIVDVLAALAHRPTLRGGAPFADLERRGAGLFRDRCASCHAPRLITRDASTAQPFEAWEDLVRSDAAPLTWATDDYQKTGVEPYVHEDGARTPSLRRVVEKRPYFTNGSAATLGEVLARARFDGERFFHDVTAPASRRELDPSRLASLSDSDIEALRAFLARL
jgi:hypothetical protein